MVRSESRQRGLKALLLLPGCGGRPLAHRAPCRSPPVARSLFLPGNDHRPVWVLCPGPLAVSAVVHVPLKPSVPLSRGFPGGSDGKESACNAGDLGSISGLGRSPGEGHGHPLQCSCSENPMDRGAWLQSLVTKSWTRLSDFRFLSGGSVVKNLPANAGDTGLIPGLGRSHMLWSS